MEQQFPSDTHLPYSQKDVCGYSIQVWYILGRLNADDENHKNHTASKIQTDDKFDVFCFLCLSLRSTNVNVKLFRDVQFSIRSKLEFKFYK